MTFGHFSANLFQPQVTPQPFGSSVPIVVLLMCGDSLKALPLGSTHFLLFLGLHFSVGKGVVAKNWIN